MKLLIDHHQHGVGSDVTSIFLIAGNYVPLILSVYPIAIKWLQFFGLLFGVLASVVVIIDHIVRICWKLKHHSPDNHGHNDKNENDGQG